MTTLEETKTSENNNNGQELINNNNTQRKERPEEMIAQISKQPMKVSPPPPPPKKNTAIIPINSNQTVKKEVMFDDSITTYILTEEEEEESKDENQQSSRINNRVTSYITTNDNISMIMVNTICTNNYISHTLIPNTQPHRYMWLSNISYAHIDCIDCINYISESHCSNILSIKQDALRSRCLPNAPYIFMIRKQYHSLPTQYFSEFYFHKDLPDNVKGDIINAFFDRPNGDTPDKIISKFIFDAYRPPEKNKTTQEDSPKSLLQKVCDLAKKVYELSQKVFGCGKQEGLAQEVRTNSTDATQQTCWQRFISCFGFGSSTPIDPENTNCLKDDPEDTTNPLPQPTMWQRIKAFCGRCLFTSTDLDNTNGLEKEEDDTQDSKFMNEVVFEVEVVVVTFNDPHNSNTNPSNTEPDSTPSISTFGKALVWFGSLFTSKKSSAHTPTEFVYIISV
jgi:hypothetical protein